MAHPSTVTVSPAQPPQDTRQARLDAAIALFRSEASASGYVVEEVRLRLPVPDVDVLPRVVIAQQSSSMTCPTPYPRAKHHRGISAYPQSEVSRGATTAQLPPCPTSGGPAPSYGVSRPASSNNASLTVSAGRGGGSKRTISGSVIFRSVPPRSASHKMDTGQQNLPSQTTRMGPLKSISCTAKQSISVIKTGGSATLCQESGASAPRGQFWNTVIDEDQAAMKPLEIEKKTPLPLSVASSEKGDKNSSYVPTPSNYKQVQITSDGVSPKTSEADIEDCNHHINGHSIPKSHVQLLLSSIGDLSCRPTETMTTSPSTSPASPRLLKKANSPSRGTSGVLPSGMSSPKRSDSHNVARPKTNGTLPPTGRAAPELSGHWRSRRDHAERPASRASAARPFRCSKCPSSFDREGHLRVHILAVHEKKRPFVCQVCDSSFGHSSSLLRHVRTVHQASPAVGPGNGSGSGASGRTESSGGRSRDSNAAAKEEERHFRCSACALLFNRVAELNRHVAKSHPLQTPMPSHTSIDVGRST